MRLLFDIRQNRCYNIVNCYVMMREVSEMTRRESREAAIELIYESLFSPERDAEEVIGLAEEIRFEAKISGFARQLYTTVQEHVGEIDTKIAECADNWRIDRIGRVTLSVLRLAACELMYFSDIPTEITVNEALELTKKFDDEKTVGFVNGVLGKLAKSVRTESVESDE